MAMTSMRDGVAIRYEIQGPAEAPALLLISGTGHDRTFWSGQLADFSKSWRTVVFDNRGTGASTVPDHSYTLADMADDGAHVLAAAGIARAHVMGFSMGGHIAQEMALNHPGRVASLAIHHSWARPHTRLSLFQAARLRMARAGDREGLIDISLLALFASDYFDAHGPEMRQRRQWYIDNSPTNAGWAGQLEACLMGDTLDRLGAIDVATLVTASDLDILAGPTYAREIAAAIAGARLQILEGTGHVALIERADEFAAQCLDFLDTAASN